jgi:predicted phosphodiesterase
MSGKKYAILGDIHGNWEALTAVIEDAQAQGVTDHVCVGDIVGYNANPAECLEKVREMKCVTVRGNHDHYCSNEERLLDFQPLAASVVAWTRKQLSENQSLHLKSLPMFAKVDGFTVVHSTLDMPEKWGYVFDTLDAQSHFNYQTTTVCFYGHTHLPMVFEKQHRVTRSPYTKVKIAVGRKYFFNVGSVGQPRDGDPRSAYVVYDVQAREVESRRVPYDIARTQEKIRKAGLPERLAVRLEFGK